MPRATPAPTVQGMLDLTFEPCAGHPGTAQTGAGGTVRADAGPLAGNVLSGGLAAVLAQFGVQPIAERDAVEDVVMRELEQRGHVARVVRLRYGTLQLEAQAQAARFLRYDTAAVLEALSVAVPDQVERIVVRVAHGDAVA